MEHDDLDEDIERLNIILQDDEGGENGESDGELRALENNEEEYYSNASRPSTSSDVTASSFPTTSMCTDADDAMFKFDPNTITSETCLAMNRAYQEVLLDTLRQIEISLMENRARQRQLEESVSDKVKKTDKQTNKEANDNRTYATCLPYFRDKFLNIPPYNEDVKLKERMNEEKQHVKPKVGWSKRQRKALVDAVKLDALEQAVRPLFNKQEVEMEKLQRCKNSEEITEAKERIKKLQEEIREKQNMKDDELWKSCDYNKIDFLKISCVTFDSKYSPSECESMWNIVLRPDINRNKWKPEEEQKLEELAEKYKMRNWEQIAKELETNRTPYQCLQHYQQNISASNESKWTEEEDELLKEVVETCSYGRGRVKWFQVAYYIDGRTADQCYARWNKIDPKRNFGRWTKEEDKQLLDAVQKLGGGTKATMNWSKIQEHVPTRNAGQCRERFLSRISGDLLYKPWTYDDDKKLLTLFEEHGRNWVEIAKNFEARTDNMVLLRHKRLVKWQRLSEGFYSQPKNVQKELKHQAFRFLKTGVVVPKDGLRLRFGKKGSIKYADRFIARKKYKTELEKLKDLGGHLSDIDSDDNDNGENEDKDNEDNYDDDEFEDDEEEEEEMDESKKKLQDSLDAFLSLYNIEGLDYYRQIVDQKNGALVVPRPPPIKRKKMTHSLSLWNKHARLNDVVVSQIDLYVKQLQDQEQDGDDSAGMKMNLYEQISKNIKKGDDQEKKRMISEAFRGKNPCNLSVRELLNISRCIKEHGKPPKNPKEFDKKPWEVDTSEEEAEPSSESEEEEQFQEEEEKPKKEKKPLSKAQKEHLQALEFNSKKYQDMMYQIKQLVLSKMDPKEVNRRGRRRQFLMYPKQILMKYRGLDEDRRLNRKSLVLLMKTLDVNSRKAYFKAQKGKRKLSAMAFLKTAEKANLKRAKTRRQKQEIQETAKIETNMNTELSEVSDYLLDIKDELDINADDTDENAEEMSATEEDDQDQPNFGYDKSLPYIPPNRTNLLAMKTLLLEHRYLIDQADVYFNLDELKQKLYDLKKKGPNPLMGVLNAVKKTESAARKRRENRLQLKMNQKDCKEQMDEIRKTTAYLKLKARFQSMFTWPALMATIQPPKGKPLPEPLQNILRKPSVTKVDEKPVQPEQKEGTVKEDEDNGEEDVTDLPEEEAVEKLVDKIMEEYEKERSKKKSRVLSTKRPRNFSEKRKKAFVEKERTKILKKLGLYEKMQEFKRRRLEAAENNPSSYLTSATATSTVTSSTVTSIDTVQGSSVPDVPVTSIVNSSPATSTSTTTGPSMPVVSETLVVNSSTATSTSTLPGPSMPDVAKISTETPKVKMECVDDAESLAEMPDSNDIVVQDRVKIGEPVNLSEGCQADFPLGDTEMAEKDGNSEVVSKRKRGRPFGAKTKCYGTSPVRKSRRKVDTDVVVKLEQDYEMSPPKKKTQNSRKNTQYANVRSLIPDKMSKIASQIPELPILKEPLPEKKRLKKPKEKKPPKEKKKVAKSKYSKDFVNLMKKDGKSRPGPKAHRLFKKFKESKAEKASSSCTNHLIKTEPLDSDDEESAAKTARHTITVNEFESIKSTPAEMVEQRKEDTYTARKSLPFSQNKGKNTVNLKKKSAEAQNQDQVLEQKRTDNSTESAAKNVNVENTKEQGEDAVLQKPMIIAIPVMIAGVQQVACIPFFPDKDGNITLPNGKKIDASSASNAGASSLPVVNFDQPFQVLNPSQQTSTSLPVAGQQQPGAVERNQSFSELKQILAKPSGSVSLLNPRMTQTVHEKQISAQGEPSLNKNAADKKAVTTKSNSNQTSSVDSK